MMKFRGVFPILFLWMSLSFPQALAADVYCSLHDGRKSDGKSVLEQGGARHEFCCSGCLEQFKADPEKFAQQVHQPAVISPADAEAACSSVCKA